jgi:hypothetical protein
MTMTFDEWIRYGLKKKWCSVPLCETHDGLPMTKEEQEAWDEGGDPCVHVIKLYSSPEEKEEAEADFAPSEWRNHYKD